MSYNFSIGQNEKFEDRLGVGELTVGKELTVKDDKFQYMSDNPSDWDDLFAVDRANGRVVLSIDHTNSTYQPVGYTATVTLEVSYKIWNGSAFETRLVSPNPVMEVVYSINNSYKDKTVLQYPGAHEIYVKVLNINPLPSSTVMNLALEAEIDIDRNYRMDRKVSATAGSTEIAGKGELQVFWDFIPGAEEYELEWAYLDFYDANKTESSPAYISVPARTFELNSSRISTSNTYYNIPLIYEPGYIIYRVRGIDKVKDNKNKIKTVPGKWSFIPAGNATVNDFLPANAFRFDGHNTKLNWQYKVGYAEEGKSKVSVTYFDGSMRNRQTVSKINSEEETIAGETIYDREGKGVIQTLPAPTGRQKLDYNPDLNVDKAQNPYSSKNFDKDNASICLPAADIMDSTSGSSRYYSASNPDKSGVNAYIPTASGYPFTHTQYTPDNTGRIKAASAVGGSHYLGSGHETKYVYGKPFAEELDRLFGSEAGNALHYKKNMVVDANGQITVTYLDGAGKTIATALAGKAPASLDSLDATADPVLIDLLGKIHNTDKKGQYEEFNYTDAYRKVSHTKPVSTNDFFNFDYELRGEQYTEECTDNGNTVDFCYNCVLELEIMLTDDCGERYLTGLNASTPEATAIIIGEETLDSIRNGTFTSTVLKPQTYNFSKLDWKSISQLQPGTYHINKVLRINKEALDYYTTDYIDKNKCLTPYSAFLTQALNEVDTIGCEITCEVCLSRLGGYDQYDRNVNPDCAPCLTEVEYNEKLGECQALCNLGAVNCEAAFGNMLTDMTIFGQYATFLKKDGTFGPDELSIFNDNNRLPRKRTDWSNANIRPHWRNPVVLDSRGRKTNVYKYLDHLGNESLIPYLYNEAQEKYLPEIIPGATTVPY